MRVTENRDTAVKLFETFTARGMKKEQAMPFTWPTRVRRVGTAVAELYRSNKWKSDLKDFEDYKHIAESHHNCFVVPGFLREKGNSSRGLPVHGPTVNVSELIQSPAPQYFAVLAPLLGIQLHLDGPDGSPMDEEDGLYEVSVAHAHLGATRTVRGGHAFLFVYTQAGVHMIITGDELDVTADGITG